MNQITPGAVCTPLRVCEFCGDTTDVLDRNRYVGGWGYQSTAECRNRVTCWARIDAMETVRDDSR